MADQPSLFDDDAPPHADLRVTLPADLDDPDARPADLADDLTAVEADEARETLFLADAMALAYRAFFSMKNASLSAPDGTDTRTLYGFATALLKLLEDERPEHIAVVFDALGGQPTFRDQLYDDYKAHRPPMPPEIKINVPLIKRLVQAFDIPVLEVEGVEADDVIGTLAKRAEDEGVDAVIFSADKDFRQLLSDRVSMLRPPYMGETFDRETPETFREKYGGLEPAQFVDLLALMGDSSDNVPGVPGIGEKTAVKLIDQYGDVESLIEHAADLKGKRAREGMTNHADDARLSKKLVTIRTDVPLEGPDGQELDWHTLRRTDPDLDEINALFDEVGFGSRLRNRARDYAEGRLRQRADGKPGRAFTTLPEDDPSLSFDFGPYEPVTALDEDAVAYTTVYEQDDLDAAAALVEGAERLSFDTETTSTDSMRARLVGVSLAAEEKRAVYVPTPLPDGTPEQQALAPIRAALEDDALLKVGHNVKYDLEVMARHGVTVRGPIFDTMVAHYLLNPEASHKLDDVASFHLNYRPQPITDLIGTGKNALTMDQVPVEDVGPYACEDADVALRLVPILTEALKEIDGGEGRLLQIAQEIEFPLVPVLAQMEMAGVKVDEKVLAEISRQLDAQLAELEEQITEQAGRPFGIGSTKQLGEVLFNPPPTDEEKAAAVQWEQDVKDNEAGEVEGDPDAKPKTKKQLAEEAPTFGVGLKPLGKTKTGKPKTDEGVLSELAQEHPLPALVLDWRKVSKLKSTYVDKLPELIHPDTGRVHTDFNQTVTATGRLSCLPAGTLVNTDRGLVGIESVQPGERVRTPFGPRRVLAWQATGVKPMVALHLSHGAALRCSPEHRVRSRGRWVRADALRPGDPVYLTHTDGLFGTATELALERTAAYATRKSPRLPEHWTPSLAELVGYVMADGHIARSAYNGKPSKVVLAFGWGEEDLMDHFSDHIQALFGKEPTRRTTRTCPVLEVSGVDIGGAIEQLGAGGLSADIGVPPGLFGAPEPVVAAFLRGYFEGDGCVAPDYGISVRSVSRGMLEGVQHLLTLFGIPSGITEGSADPRGYAPRFTLRISGDRSKRAFHKRIGFLSDRKRRACADLASKPTSKSRAELLTLPEDFDLAPVQTALYDALRDGDGRVPNAVHQFTSKLRGETDTVVLSRAEWVVDHVNEAVPFESASFLEEAVAARYFEVTVSTIEHEAATPMFDIAVEDVEQYTAQGIVVHNSSNPNLQNIPIRTDLGKEIRRAFVAEPGHVLMAADYAQIELRIIASMSGDPDMTAAFAQAQDIHTAAAARVFSVDYDAVTRAQRDRVKQVNYGIPYGISAFGLANRLRIGNAEAQELIDQYRQSYPRVIAFLDGLIEEARERGYVETLLGRRRYLPLITSRNPNDRAFAERVAVNMPIQGTQADMIKIAMIAIQAGLADVSAGARMILQVHDELVFEVPEPDIEPVSAFVREQMATAFPLGDVPIVVDVGVADNWLDAH